MLRSLTMPFLHCAVADYVHVGKVAAGAGPASEDRGCQRQQSRAHRIRRREQPPLACLLQRLDVFV